MPRTAPEIMADVMKLLTPWQQSQVIDYALLLATANKPKSTTNEPIRPVSNEAPDRWRAHQAKSAKVVATPARRDPLPASLPAWHDSELPEELSATWDEKEIPTNRKLVRAHHQQDLGHLECSRYREVRKPRLDELDGDSENR